MAIFKLTRKRDWLYLIFFITHIPIMLGRIPASAALSRSKLVMCLRFRCSSSKQPLTAQRVEFTTYSGGYCSLVSKLHQARISGHHPGLLYQYLPRPILHQSSSMVQGVSMGGSPISYSLQCLGCHSYPTRWVLSLLVHHALPSWSA